MLHPSEQSYSNSRLKTNALSCVLKITTSHGSVLLPADIEKKSEYQLLEELAMRLPQRYWSRLITAVKLLPPMSLYVR